MDILNLVNKLEDLFNQGVSVPFTHNVMLNEDSMLEIIDQMRISIPDEIKRAQQVLAQRDRILAQAREEHDRTIEIAREKREQMVSANEIIAESKKRADQIISQAHSESEIIRREADRYTLESLRRIEHETDRIMNQVRNGIRTLQHEQENNQDRPS